MGSIKINFPQVEISNSSLALVPSRSQISVRGGMTPMRYKISGPEFCDGFKNHQLCPIPESGCQNETFGHTCICSHNLLSVDPIHGCLVHTDLVPVPFPESPSSTIILNPPNNPKEQSGLGLTASSIVILSSIIAVLIIVILLFFGLIILYRKRNGRSIFSRNNSRLRSQSLTSHQDYPIALNGNGTLAKCIKSYVKNPNYHPGDNMSKLINEIEIQRENVTYSESDKIGEGAFGRVYRGIYKRRNATNLSGCDEEEEETLTVAIKVLKPGLSVEAESDFEREIEILASFNHQNIVKLLGICRLSDSSTMPCIIFEFMEWGDLTEVLRSRSPKKLASNDKISLSDKELQGDKGKVLTNGADGNESSTESTVTKQLSREDLIWIAAQIANGMLYLSQQHFVHRDLATRNCLVGKNLIVKISDFGMSRDIYTCDYYKISGTRLLPIRWMAPESILYGKFTLESDIWSFGVVLWEIFSYGKQPYYGHSNEEVVKLILQGILLIPPDECPDFIYKIMSLTWKSNPRDRVSFDTILDIFMVNCREEKRKQLGNTKKRSCNSLSKSGVKQNLNTFSVGQYRSGTKSLNNSVSSSANSSAASAITFPGNISSHPVATPCFKAFDVDDVSINSNKILKEPPLEHEDSKTIVINIEEGSVKEEKDEIIYKYIRPKSGINNQENELLNCTNGGLSNQKCSKEIGEDAAEANIGKEGCKNFVVRFDQGRSRMSGNDVVKYRGVDETTFAEDAEINKDDTEQDCSHNYICPSEIEFNPSSRISYQ